MFAYADETGNTGHNLFDPVQPDFLTAALVTKTDFDISHRSAIAGLAAAAGVTSLHGNELGVERLETIAGPLLKIFKKADARFFISRVEKRYLLATKVIDTFFDSGENRAVPWHVYNIRPLRIMLVFKASLLLDDELAKAFWACLMAKREPAAYASFREVCDEFLRRIESLPDQRSRDLFREAVSWAKKNSEAIHLYSFDRFARQGHLPNLVAFANLLDGLEAFSKRWDRRVRRIVHDRQAEFEKTLAAWHGLFSNASPEPIFLPGETRVIQKVVTSEFELKTDEESPGIQAIDVVLWLFRQVTKGEGLPFRCGQLMDLVFKRAWQHDFSFDGVSRAIQEQFGEVLSSPLDDAQWDKAHEMLGHFEQNRENAMRLYADEKRVIDSPNR